MIDPSSAAVSVYKPENGAALNLVGGVDFTGFLTLQGNYVWNRNSLVLTSTLLSQDGDAFYEQRRDSGQHSVIGDLLLYFRKRGDPVRPYLSTGFGFAYFESSRRELLAIRGMPSLPPIDFSSTRPVLRVAVGIDFAVGSGWYLRYSFSETIRGNPISAELSPPGMRNLANFQNLFRIYSAFLVLETRIRAIAPVDGRIFHFLGQEPGMTQAAKIERSQLLCQRTNLNEVLENAQAAIRLDLGHTQERTRLFLAVQQSRVSLRFQRGGCRSAGQVSELIFRGKPLKEVILGILDRLHDSTSV